MAPRQRRTSDGDPPRACCLRCGAELIIARDLKRKTLIELETDRPRGLFTLWAQPSIAPDLDEPYPDAMPAPVYRVHVCREQ